MTEEQFQKIQSNILAKMSEREACRAAGVPRATYRKRCNELLSGAKKTVSSARENKKAKKRRGIALVKVVDQAVLDLAERRLFAICVNADFDDFPTGPAKILVDALKGRHPAWTIKDKGKPAPVEAYKKIIEAILPKKK